MVRLRGQGDPPGDRAMGAGAGLGGLGRLFLHRSHDGPEDASQGHLHAGLRAMGTLPAGSGHESEIPRLYPGRVDRSHRGLYGKDRVSIHPGRRQACAERHPQYGIA
jgi:hypothetical protein